MPVFLDQSTRFPPPWLARPDGLLCVGGALDSDVLLRAYRRGIFPWPHEGLPMLWFSPDPRFVLYPAELHVNRSLRKSLRRARFELRVDTAFEAVIDGCARMPRPGQNGTWVTDELRDAYVALHHEGYAHSAEAWEDGELVGGLYGVSLGAAFFGESMFALRPDASKVAFVTLVQQLQAWGFGLVDCQVHTEHLERFGARHIPRRRFLRELRQALKAPTRLGPWHLDPG